MILKHSVFSNVCNSSAPLKIVLVINIVEFCCQSCNLFDSSEMHAMAGAQHEFSPICKNLKACLYPFKLLSLSLSKMMAKEASAKNGESGLATCTNHLFLRKIPVFCDNPGCRILQRKFRGDIFFFESFVRLFCVPSLWLVCSWQPIFLEWILFLQLC